MSSITAIEDADLRPFPRYVLANTAQPPRDTVTRKSCGVAKRLTPAQVAEIRALRGCLRTPEIARRFDISPGTVGNILAGRTWRQPV
jgi:DNA-binding NarL/FixJ family response regulator